MTTRIYSSRFMDLLISFTEKEEHESGRLQYFGFSNMDCGIVIKVAATDRLSVVQANIQVHAWTNRQLTNSLSSR